ncbi:MAG: ribosomal protein S18-alanine N-acetyltransferase [Rhodobacteraceae bacterium]|nr:ribosomal protein S18-alanine N-acetyltransferase [Paracoccaceae bacterium]
MTPKRCATIHASCFTTPRPWSEAEFKSLLHSPNIYICEDPSGFAMGRMAGPEAELLTIAVKPEMCGNGIGRALLSRFEKQAVMLGAKELFLEVATNNAAAIALYTSAGYSRCGQRKDYYETPKGSRLSATVFKKLLAT